MLLENNISFMFLFAIIKHKCCAFALSKLCMDFSSTSYIYISFFFFFLIGIFMVIMIHFFWVQG